MDPYLPSKSCGVCMMNTSWREKQHPAFISYISSFLAANSYRLNFLPIAPDFIFNSGGVSIAFIFETCWYCENGEIVLSRVEKLKNQFKHLYVVAAVPTREQNDSFNQYYLKYSFELGRPTFVPVRDPEMGFEKIVNIAHARGACKQRDAISMMKTEVRKIKISAFKLNKEECSLITFAESLILQLKRARATQCLDAFLHVVTAIPGIDNHDANTLAQAFGSIEAIAKASKGSILESTDLSSDKAERIFRFFRDPKYYLSPRIH